MSEWISVDDRLPEIHKEVLVLMACLGDREQIVAAFDGKVWVEGWTRNSLEDHDWISVYWQPLPAPPS